MISNLNVVLEQKYQTCSSGSLSRVRDCFLVVVVVVVLCDSHIAIIGMMLMSVSLASVLDFCREVFLFS